MEMTVCGSISPSAMKQAERAARKIVRERARDEWPALDERGEQSPALLEASYEEAMERNVYQSEGRYEEWLNWRTIVEHKVLRDLGYDVPEIEVKQIGKVY